MALPSAQDTPSSKTHHSTGLTPITDDELLEVLNLVSMVHRRLDEVRRTGRA